MLVACLKNWPSWVVTFARDLPAYIAGEIKPVPQDASQVTFSPNISPEEERLDWNKPARDIFNQIRGMYPWPVAHTLLTANVSRFMKRTW